MQPASLLAPYSQVVIPVLAVLLAGVALARFAGRSPAQAVGFGGVALVAVITASTLWVFTSGTGAAQRDALAVPAGMRLEEKCLGDQSTQQLIPLARVKLSDSRASPRRAQDRHVPGGRLWGALVDVNSHS